MTIYKEYKNHPRILEVRFILLFDMFEREVGYADAVKYYEVICGTFKGDFQKIMNVVNKRFDIKRNQKTKYTRWRQEVIFAALCYDETIYKVAKDYLITSSQNLYSNRALRPEIFINDAWLKQLDMDADLCGIPAYQNEVERFFEAVNSLTVILDKWKGGR